MRFRPKKNKRAGGKKNRGGFRLDEWHHAPANERSSVFGVEEERVLRKKKSQIEKKGKNMDMIREKDRKQQTNQKWGIER